MKVTIELEKMLEKEEIYGYLKSKLSLKLEKKTPDELWDELSFKKQKLDIYIKHTQYKYEELDDEQIEIFDILFEIDKENPNITVNFI